MSCSKQVVGTTLYSFSQINIATSNVRNDEKRDPWRRYQCMIDLDKEIPQKLAEEMVRIIYSSELIMHHILCENLFYSQNAFVFTGFVISKPLCSG